VAVKVAEVQNMARHVLIIISRNALVLWLSGQHLNRPCKSGEATKAAGKQKWPTLRNVGIRYSYHKIVARVHQ
jgi:cytochrome c peroxidase